MAEEKGRVRLAEEERVRLVAEEARGRQVLAEARAQLAEEEERVQRRLAEAEARLAEEKGRVRLAEEERVRLVAEEARARQLLVDARTQLAEEEGRARVAAEKARDRQLLAAAPELESAASVDQTVLQLPGNATVITQSDRVGAGMPHTPPVIVEAAPPLVKTAELAEAHTVLAPATESAASRQDAARAQPGQRRRMRGRPLALTVGVLLLIVSAIVVWVIASVIPSRRLQSEIAQARTQLVAMRQEVLKVGADRLAAALFADAAAKERAAEQLASAGRHEEALATLRAATQTYEEAGRVARAVAEDRTKADQARAAMLVEKKRAAPEAPQFKEALAREAEGESRYGKLAFQDAAESFRAATGLFALVLPPPPPPPPASTACPGFYGRDSRDPAPLFTGLRDEGRGAAPAAPAEPTRR